MLSLGASGPEPATDLFNDECLAWRNRLPESQQ